MEYKTQEEIEEECKELQRIAKLDAVQEVLYDMFLLDVTSVKLHQMQEKYKLQAQTRQVFNEQLVNMRTEMKKQIENHLGEVLKDYLVAQEKTKTKAAIFAKACAGLPGKGVSAYIG